MKTFIFRANTPLEALKKATLELGEDCILIETKEILTETPAKEIIYEIVIGISKELISEKNK